MRKKWKEPLFALAFVLTAALLLNFIAAVLRPAHTDYGSTWDAYLCEPEDSIDVLFFGSSYAYCDWNPGAMYAGSGLTGYVLGGSEQTPAITYWYLKEALKTQSPSVVVMEGSSLFFDRYQNYTQINIGYMPWGANQVAAIVVSIAGMFFLTGKNGSLPVLGIALAAISSLTYGSYLIANEKGPANDLPLEVKLFYVSLPGTLLFAVLAPATGNLAVPSSPVSWFQLIVCSGLATVGGYFLMMFGIQKLGASTASFLSMLEPVVSVVFGTIWFADPVTVGVVVGSVLILTSVCFITLDSSRKEKRAKEAELTGQTQS